MEKRPLAFAVLLSLAAAVDARAADRRAQLDKAGAPVLEFCKAAEKWKIISGVGEKGPEDLSGDEAKAAKAKDTDMGTWDKDPTKDAVKKRTLRRSVRGVLDACAKIKHKSNGIPNLLKAPKLDKVKQWEPLIDALDEARVAYDRYKSGSGTKQERIYTVVNEISGHLFEVAGGTAVPDSETLLGKALDQSEAP
jgi:hypothetical protein